MRRAMLATAVMNGLAVPLFLPGAASLRALAGFPAPGHPLFMMTAGLFVLLFGTAYLWAALTGCADPFFVGLAAAGKLGFVALLTGFWIAGELPLRAPLVASGDLVFGVTFVTWVWSVRAHAERRDALDAASVRRSHLSA
jgi:hypothetical protein